MMCKSAVVWVLGLTCACGWGVNGLWRAPCAGWIAMGVCLLVLVPLLQECDV